jgi:hypothetical protein
VRKFDPPRTRHDAACSDTATSDRSVYARSNLRINRRHALTYPGTREPREFSERVSSIGCPKGTNHKRFPDNPGHSQWQSFAKNSQTRRVLRFSRRRPTKGNFLSPR